MFLTDTEMIELTGCKRPSTQCKRLTMMGIHHLVRPDGKPKVARAWVESLTGQAPARQIMNLEAIH